MWNEVMCGLVEDTLSKSLVIHWRLVHSNPVFSLIDTMWSSLMSYSHLGLYVKPCFTFIANLSVFSTLCMLGACLISTLYMLVECIFPPVFTRLSLWARTFISLFRILVSLQFIYFHSESVSVFHTCILFPHLAQACHCHLQTVCIICSLLHFTLIFLFHINFNKTQHSYFPFSY